MNCCIECFSDPQIQAMISANGKYGNCDFCKKTNVLICTVDEPSDVSDLISEVLNVYEESEDGEVFHNVKRKQFDIKPMSLDEAIMQMELLGHAFFVFINYETETVNVVYKRKDNKYGLLEPNY